MKKRILIALVVVLALAATASLVWANPDDPWADSPIAIYRVNTGTNSGGASIDTTWDDGDDGIDATGPADWLGAIRTPAQITTVGIDEKSNTDPNDDHRGWVVLAFTDNVCLDDPGADLYIYDAWGSQSVNGNESADIDVAIGNGSFAAAGSVSPGAYALDVSGASPYFTRVRVTVTDFDGQLTLAGLDLDAVECLNSVNLSEISLSAANVGPIFNPVGAAHTVQATISPIIEGVEVSFDITGPNSAESGSAVTNASGVASFTYTGSAAGTDSILASVTFEGTTITAPAVEKIWLEHYVTGGGRIDEGKGREAAVITFAGTVRFDLAGDVVGQWQVNFHNVNVDALDKGRFHSTDFRSLEFGNVVCQPWEPDPPDADYNRAIFIADGRFNGEDGWKLEVRMTDYGEPGRDMDTILLFLKGPDGAMVYRSPQNLGGDFERNDPVCTLSSRTTLDGGNLQIHPPALP